MTQGSTCVTKRKLPLAVWVSWLLRWVLLFARSLLWVSWLCRIDTRFLAGEIRIFLMLLFLIHIVLHEWLINSDMLLIPF